MQSRARRVPAVCLPLMIVVAGFGGGCGNEEDEAPSQATTSEEETEAPTEPTEAGPLADVEERLSGAGFEVAKRNSADAEDAITVDGKFEVTYWPSAQVAEAKFADTLDNLKQQFPDRVQYVQQGQIVISQTEERPLTADEQSDFQKIATVVEGAR